MFQRATLAMVSALNLFVEARSFAALARSPALKRENTSFQASATSRGKNLETRSGSGPFGVWRVDRLVSTAYHPLNVRENDGANAARI